MGEGALARTQVGKGKPGRIPGRYYPEQHWDGQEATLVDRRAPRGQSPAPRRLMPPTQASDMPSSIPPIVLTFAATDPTGGAGIQADILTLSSMG